jgi:hypothetical protein
MNFFKENSAALNTVKDNLDKLFVQASLHFDKNVHYTNTFG